MSRTLTLTALATLAAAALAGCGSTSSTVTRTAAVAPALTQTAAVPVAATQTAAAPTTISRAQAAKEYLAAITPYKTSASTFDAQVKVMPDSATAATFAKIGAPLAQALTNLRPGLLALAGAYPAAAVDIKALVTASAPVIGDLDNIATMTDFSVTSWAQQFITDGTAQAAAVAIVRSDLGLPPAPTS